MARTTPTNTTTETTPGAVLPGQVRVTDPEQVRSVLAALGLDTDRLPAALVVQLPKADRPAPLCGCGCGEATRGGRFIPGHDARLKSALHARVRAGGEDGAAAAADLDERGWPQPAPKKAKKAPVADEAAAA